MAKLGKNVLAHTFKFDCDRYLRFRLASDTERQRLDLGADKYKRPGINLAIRAGDRWEIDKYQDLIDLLGTDQVVHRRADAVDPELGSRRFENVPEEILIELLRRATPPSFIIEGAFEAPPEMVDGLADLYARYGLERISIRPDILWIRPGGTGAPLITRHRGDPAPDYEIHIIDIKKAAEPSLRHFVEVTFYALALARWLLNRGLADRYAVSAEGFIWPGSHDVNAFKEHVRTLRANSAADPVTLALVGNSDGAGTLRAVPYEVYQVHVAQFFSDRLPRVLSHAPEEAEWHVAPKCQLCEFLPYCQTEAKQTDHLSRLPWLTRGQAALLRLNGLDTTARVVAAIATDSPEWQHVVADSHQLRAGAPAVFARARALQPGPIVPIDERIAWLSATERAAIMSQGITTIQDLRQAVESDNAYWQAICAAIERFRSEPRYRMLSRLRAATLRPPEVIEGRTCATMPRSSSMSIYITVHFDPSSGLTFAIGCSRLYFPPDHTPGSPPITGESSFVVDRVENFSAETERRRLNEFIDVLGRWVQEAHEANERIARERREGGEDDSDYGKVTVHVYFWDQLEVTQFRRMLERHMNNPATLERIDLLLQMFPPESMLPDPDTYKAQPGTTIKDVMKLLFGLPIAHDYTLFNTANTFYPDIRDDSSVYEYGSPYGFAVEGNDQIPFERAFELWEDRVYLRHPDGRLYTRDEVRDGIAKAVTTRLDALQHIVRKLQQEHRSLLTLRKSSFTLAPKREMTVPDSSRQLITFARLNAVADELENRQVRALPVDEREARFSCIRGLRLISGADYNECLAEIRRTKPRFAERPLHAFTFSPNSRDTRIRENDFPLAISNEDPPLDLDVRWREYVGLRKKEAADLVGWGIADAPLYRLLQISIAYLDTTGEMPFLVLAAANDDYLTFAQENDLLDLDRALVLDKIYLDQQSKMIESALRVVGGPYTRRSRGSSRRPMSV